MYGEGSGEGGEGRGRETWITGIHYNDECNYLINCWFLYFLHYLKFWMHLEAILSSTKSFFFPWNSCFFLFFAPFEFVPILALLYFFTNIYISKIDFTRTVSTHVSLPSITQ